MSATRGKEPPKYRRIADDLRARIEGGEYPADSRLPTKAELMAHYKAALSTVDHAIEELRKQGCVDTVQGVGTFARQPPTDSEHSAEYIAVMQQVAEISQEVRQLREEVRQLREMVRDHDVMLRDLHSRVPGPWSRR